MAQRFQENRPHLRAIAYRMLGSIAEAEDAVQEAWLRLSSSDAKSIENLAGWLTTVTGRICLDILRQRKSRREQSLDTQMPEPVLNGEGGMDPEDEMLIADSVGFALLVVLETLSPQERLAFVLHDMFDVPFAEIASILGCSQEAARQLASRGRHRVKGAPAPDADLTRQREVVDAFVSAVRNGDFEALVALLHPDVVVRSDREAEGARIIRGARAVASQALVFSRLAGQTKPVLVNGVAGVLSWRPDGQPFSLMTFTIQRGKIVEIHVLSDPERLRQLDLSSLTD